MRRLLAYDAAMSGLRAFGPWRRISFGAAVCLAAAGCSAGSLVTSTAQVSPSPTAHLSNTQQFVSALRNGFGFGTDTKDGYLINLGQEVCQARQRGAVDQALVPQVVKLWTNTSNGDGLQIVRLAEQYLCPSALDAKQTITYVVTGARGVARVEFGPDVTPFNGTVPMSVTQPLNSSLQDFSVNAQLTGTGKVSCAIQVDGVSISTKTVSTRQAVASCGVSLDPDNNAWEDNNSS
jgi:Protein of unknown function (DUF732)